MKSITRIVLVCGFFAPAAHAATILEGWTAVSTLDFTNVVGAWNFVTTASAPGSPLSVQGVSFTTVGAGNGTYGNLTVGGLLNNGTSGFTTGQAITGGTDPDAANLTTIVNSGLNGLQGTAAGNDITLDLTGLSNGTYKIQYFFAINGNTDRQFSVSAEGSVLGQFVRTSGTTYNYLLTDEVAVTDGTLNIRAIAETADLDERRLISGLIVSSVPVPEPTSALLGGIGLLFLLRRRR